MTDVDRITELEFQLAQDEDLGAKLARYIKRENEGEHKEMVKGELERLQRRIDYTRDELSKFHSLRSSRALRGRQPAVRFLGIEKTI